MLRVGLPDRYVTHGKPALLREEVGLTPEAVAERVAQAVLEPTAPGLARLPRIQMGNPAWERDSKIGGRSNGHTESRPQGESQQAAQDGSTGSAVARARKSNGLLRRTPQRRDAIEQRVVGFEERRSQSAARQSRGKASAAKPFQREP